MSNTPKSVEVETILKSITIPKYFNEIVVPAMPGYYSDYTVDFDGHPVVKCPLHGEDTPSFRWYEETNSFFCFGCRAGGDVINLHRKVMSSIHGQEVGYKEAVTFLYNYFIQGKQVEIAKTTVKTEEEIEEEKSTSVELILLSNFLNKLEDMLRADTKLDPHTKFLMYEAIDNVRQLVSLKEIGAKDALSYLKGIA